MPSGSSESKKADGSGSGRKKNKYKKLPEGLRSEQEAAEGADEGVGLLLDAPQLKLEGLSLELKDVRVAKLIELGELKVSADNLDAQLLLKLRLDDLLKAVNRFFESLDSTASRVQEISQDNPEIVQTLIQSIKETAREALSDSNEPEGGEAETTHLSVDEAGNIVEIVLDGSGQVVDESVRGNVRELPVEEEFFDDGGGLVSRWRDESGNLFEGRFDEEGNLAHADVVREPAGETA